MSGAVAGAVLSSIATIIQMTIVIGMVQPSLLTALMLLLIFGGVAAGLYGLLFFIRRGGRQRRQKTTQGYRSSV